MSSSEDAIIIRNLSACSVDLLVGMIAARKEAVVRDPESIFKLVEVRFGNRKEWQRFIGYDTVAEKRNEQAMVRTGIGAPRQCMSNDVEIRLIREKNLLEVNYDEQSITYNF